MYQDLIKQLKTVKESSDFNLELAQELVAAGIHAYMAVFVEEQEQDWQTIESQGQEVDTDTIDEGMDMAFDLTRSSILKQLDSLLIQLQVGTLPDVDMEQLQEMARQLGIEDFQNPNQNGNLRKL